MNFKKKFSFVEDICEALCNTMYQPVTITSTTNGFLILQSSHLLSKFMWDSDMD